MPGGPGLKWAGSGSARLPGQAQISSSRQVNPGYETLIEPDGPIVFAGDHVSHIVAWQEGAALSAQRAVQQVCDRVKAAKLAESPGAIKS